MSSPVSNRPAKILDLEVKDARIIFNPCWEALEEEVGRENLRFPKEILLLGGAPGAGKGTQTQFINGPRGLTGPPIVISELLTTPEMEKLKAQGVMVGDKEVVSLLLRKLLEPEYRDGVVLDGFPRTPVQVECLKLLVEKKLPFMLTVDDLVALEAADLKRTGGRNSRLKMAEQAFKKAYGAGVPFVFGSGATSADVPHGKQADQFAYFIKWGMTTADALKMAFLPTASMLNYDWADRIGSIEKGKDANLIFFKGDPFELSSHLEAVMLEGEFIYGGATE